jgi:AraC-like DNA-binding protein
MAPAPDGLYRTTLAGPGRSLVDAFMSLEHSPQVDRVLRHAGRDLLSARVTLRPEEGAGYWELTRIRNDLYVILSDFSYTRARFEFVPGDGLVQFNFKLSGDLTYAVGDPGPLRFTRPALHMWRQPTGIDMQEWTAPSSHERMVTISARPQFLQSYLQAADSRPACSNMPSRLRAFVSEPSGRVDFCQLALTAPMVGILTQLLENPYQGVLYLTYQEALIYQLLCVAVAELAVPTEPATPYSQRELCSLAAARKLLAEQFTPAPSLQRLARSVGLSERALTRAFKAVYGETVFDFGLRCRMQRAMSLLQDRRWSVDRVSDAVGYAHPTSFATAFRRHFGLRPIDVKPLKRRRPIS